MAKPTRDEVIGWAKKQNLDVDNFIDELDQYKTAHNKLTAGLKEAVAESIKYKRERDELSNKLDKECNDNYKLEGQLHDMTKQRDLLIKDVKQQRELLIDFSRFIHRKVEACPGKPEYMDFRDRLNELGIGERE
ncbi:hypothetical protein B5723_14505 [Mammaliicoccus sciuri]|uniref:hypothetical protein n=1 Tax=Mammaliicoccus sciuri TaxID=1296 RepID=UPI000A013237|nr:hypothetical protein [Mammaliicoccus sciuri]ORI00671.1 hypothetical protein B5723_14505 [Mammaliicoccus sciuri]